jgi:hypothetical protein
MTTETSWSRLRSLVKRRDNATCFHCGKVDDNGHCDHLIPLSRGGTDSILNLVWSCSSCNLEKSNNLPDWIADLHSETPKPKSQGKTQSYTPNLKNLWSSIVRVIANTLAPQYPKYDPDKKMTFNEYFDLIISYREQPLSSWLHDAVWDTDSTIRAIIKYADQFVEEKSRCEEGKLNTIPIDSFEMKCIFCDCPTFIVWEEDIIRQTLEAKWLCPAGHSGSEYYIPVDKSIKNLKETIYQKARVAVLHIG